jgi:hypothetical protein
MNAQTPITAGAAVYRQIAAVQGELAHTGIGKDSENTFDRYKFRGIDAVYNALAPLLAKHGLCVLPRIIERDCQERVSRKGEPMFYVTVTAEFDFVAAEDGSIHTVRTYGEAMDRSDKATNKAMSAAYKYAAFMAFAIPTEGDNDADAATPMVEARQPVQQERPAKQPAHSALKSQVREFVSTMEGCGDWDEWAAFRDSKEAQSLLADVRKKLPQWWEGGPDMPAEFVPLRRRIEVLEANLANKIADVARA